MFFWKKRSKCFAFFFFAKRKSDKKISFTPVYFSIKNSPKRANHVKRN